MPSTEDFVAVGLYDPAADAPVGRLELLEWLAAKGFTLDDMIAAQQAGGLNALATDWKTLPGERLTRAAAMETSGLSSDDFDAFTRALGFTRVQRAPDGEIGITAADLEALTLFASLADSFTREEAIGLVRVIGAAVARVAEASVSMFLNDIEAHMLASGGSELDLATSAYDLIDLIPALSGQFDSVLRRHVQQAVERTRVATIEHNERFLYRYAIGFVDLVGFTEVSRSMEPRTLAKFMRDFEGRAHDVVTAGDARIVKLIGDEVMFAATDADAACQAAGALMDGFGTDRDHVVPRAGIAFGEVLVRGGDYYGTIVNLASRLVDEAVPQELLVTQEVATAAEGHHFEPAGRRMVKGFEQPVTVLSLLRDE
jgi:class 3 adenylate cyclase